VWTTTADGTKVIAWSGRRLIGSLRIGQVISINPAKTAQTFAGTGAALTGSSAALISALPQSDRDAVMKTLFGADGLHLNLLRQPLGSSDFVTSNAFTTYEDTQGAFDLGSDRTGVLPLVRQAKALNPAVSVMGTPWTAPAWMKTSGSLAGGALADDMVDSYASYLASTAAAYAAEGTPLADMTIGNEPGHESNYPTMRLSADQQIAVLRATDAHLAALNLPTRLWAYDHNWDGAAEALQVLRGVAELPRVVGAAFHCYGGDPAAATAAVVKAGWRVRETECTGVDSNYLPNTFAETLGWQTKNLLISSIRNGSESLMLWNLALNGSGGPQFGACGIRCNGVIEIKGTTISRNADYAVLGQVSRFVSPGAKVLLTKQSTGGVENVAFLNPGGRRIVVLANYNASFKTVSIEEDGRAIVTVLPPGSLSTVIWH
jgi:glucosylceramidase